jgi:hypothetical protein
MKYLIIVIVLSTVLLLMGWIWSVYNKKTKIMNPMNGVVTLVEISPMKSGFSATYEYLCGNQVMYCNGATPMYFVIGDKYWAYIDSLDCSSIKIDYARPLFTTDELTQEVIGEIFNVTNVPLLGWEYVKFKYKTIDGTEFKRLQSVNKEYLDKNKNSIKKSKFKVKYWIKNPQRSVIYLDKPVG